MQYYAPRYTWPWNHGKLFQFVTGRGGMCARARDTTGLSCFGTERKNGEGTVNTPMRPREKLHLSSFPISITHIWLFEPISQEIYICEKNFFIVNRIKGLLTRYKYRPVGRSQPTPPCFRPFSFGLSLSVHGDQVKYEQKWREKSVFNHNILCS